MQFDISLDCQTAFKVLLLFPGEISNLSEKWTENDCILHLIQQNISDRAQCNNNKN